MGGLLVAESARGDFDFVLIGDRTGDTVPGVWQQVWEEAAAENPAFAVTAGDTIQGLNDSQLKTEWRDAMRFLRPIEERFPIFFTPGNHDVWSAASAGAYHRYTRHPLHYGFDWDQAHFTILADYGNNPLEPLSSTELAFLKEDLAQHGSQPLKFVVSHRPFWLMNALLGNVNGQAQKVAKQYGVQYFIAGHLHQMLHYQVDGIQYISLPSAGGHLRASQRYKDGWFFGHIFVQVNGVAVHMKVEEARAPCGEGRVTTLQDWTGAGLTPSTK